MMPPKPKPEREKTLVCMNRGCRQEFTHRGCACRSRCPRCGARGSSVEIKDGKVIY